MLRKRRRTDGAAESITTLKDIQRRLGLSQEIFARLLGVSVRTLSRWLTQTTEAPAPDHMNEIRDLQTVLDAAKRSLAPGAVPVWFRSPNPVLGDLSPIDLLPSRRGQELVKALLGKIRWGLPT